MYRKINEQEIKTLLKNFTFLRKQNRLSKKAMAYLLGIGIASLNKIEKGELPPRLSVAVLFRIQSHFGIRCKEQFLDLPKDNVNIHKT